MKITIETIPHNQQRYDTCGDWQFDKDGNLEVKVSELGDWKMELLIGLHEVIESCLCKESGISGEDIDAFDMEFEKNRLPGNTDEPGDSPKAPYRKQHFQATNIERILADCFGVDWSRYNDIVNNL